MSEEFLPGSKGIYNFLQKQSCQVEKRWQPHPADCQMNWPLCDDKSEVLRTEHC